MEDVSGKSSSSLEENEPAVIELPANSFTASRFRYGDAEEISGVSGVVLLGSIPRFWYKEQKNGLLKKWSKARYSEVRHGFIGLYEKSKLSGRADMNKDFHSIKLLRLLKKKTSDDDDFDDDYDDDDDDNDNESDLFDLASDGEDEDESYEDNHDIPETHTVPQTVLQPQSIINLRKHESNTDQSTIVLPKIEETPASTASLPVTSNIATESFYSAMETLPSKNVDQNGSSAKLPRREPQNNSQLRVQVPNSSTPNFSRPITMTNSNLTVDSEVSNYAQRMVRFNSQEPNRSKSRSSSKVQNVKPAPTRDLIASPLEPRHKEAFERVKRVASRTKGRLKKDFKKVDQRKLLRKFMKHYKAGEIVKKEKMLVLVKMTDNVKGSKFTHFTEVEPCDTRILERWKEYIVVTRSTGNINEPLLLQFYTKREIPDVSESKHSDDDLDVVITRDCLVDFYSSLDKTISIVKNSKVYIMRCQTPTSAIRWYTLLKGVLGVIFPNTLKVEIPTLKISVNLNLSSDFYEKFTLVPQEKDICLYYKDNGYRLKNSAMIEYLSEKVKRRLLQTGFSDIVDRYEGTEHILGFCWRHYDRLEWLFGETLNNLFWQQSMHLSHDLELRQVRHYPRTVEIADKDLETPKVMKEPPPIEGFLVRLSTKEGHLRRGLFKKQVFGFNYFHTCDYLLYFTTSFKASPPIPYFDDLMSDPTMFLAQPENFERVRSVLSDVYYNNPFPLNEQNHIEWIHPDLTAEEFENRENYALAEFERRVGAIKKAHNVLNLLEVSIVENYDPSTIPIAVEAANDLLWSDVIEAKNLKHDKHDDTYFKIQMENGSKIVLKAPNTLIRDEWVKRLNDLSVYWKARIHDDAARILKMKEANRSHLQIDDYTESNHIGTDEYSSTRWETSRGTADSTVFNITPYSMFRPIIKSGILYQKPKKHSTFRKYFVVSVPGSIILYNMSVRNARGKIKPTTHYTHYMTIPLDDCYIYSGAVCEPDLLKRESGSNTMSAGRNNSIPRVYEDGWLSQDEETSRCFTLWFGTKRAISGKMKPSNTEKDDDFINTEFDDAENPNLIKIVSRLGVTGRSMVFMCRSRQEKDIWIENLYTELERFGKSNEL